MISYTGLQREASRLRQGGGPAQSALCARGREGTECGTRWRDKTTGKSVTGASGPGGLGKT